MRTIRAGDSRPRRRARRSSRPRQRTSASCAACRQLLDTQARLLAELDAELGRSLSIDGVAGFRGQRCPRRAGGGLGARAAMDPGQLWASLAAAAAIVLAVWIRQPDVSEPTRRADVRLSTEAAPSPATTLLTRGRGSQLLLESRRPSPAVSVRAATTASRPGDRRAHSRGGRHASLCRRRTAGDRRARAGAGHRSGCAS